MSGAKVTEAHEATVATIFREWDGTDDGELQFALAAALAAAADQARIEEKERCANVVLLKRVSGIFPSHDGRLASLRGELATAILAPTSEAPADDETRTG